MSVTSHTLFTNPNSNFSYFTNIHTIQLKNRLSFKTPPHFQVLRRTSPIPNNLITFRAHQSPVRVFDTEGTIQRDSNGVNKPSFDTFLSIAEVLCLASSAIFAIGFVVNYVVSGSQNAITVWLGNRVFVWQVVALAGGAVIGAWIRRRQWSRICREEDKAGGRDFNLVERIEKLEEDLRNSTTIIRVLSRQLEKLGIRFRVTRRSLKDPIAETAALAQKNSEATRALAVHEDILENELGEIQKVLLAMQDQQQKQLELILAIGSKRVADQKQESNEKRNSAEEGIKQMDTHQIHAATKMETNNDRV